MGLKPMSDLVRSNEPSVKDKILLLEGLTKGERLVYHTGLPATVPPSLSVAAYDLYEAGRITLTQKKGPNGTYHWIAQGRI